MPILTIANEKGGPGKTTTALHLAYLAADYGHRVLFVDFDGQANASRNLLGSEQAPEEGTRTVDLYNEHAPTPMAGAYPNIDVLAASPELKSLPHMLMQHFLATQKESDIEFDDFIHAYMDAAGQHLIGMKQSYSLIVVDTPPTHGDLLSTALHCTDYVLSPINTDQYSIDGVSMLLELIQNIQQGYNENMAFLGFLLNRVDTRSREMVGTAEHIIEQLGDLAFPEIVPFRKPIQASAGTGFPTWHTSNIRSGNDRQVAKGYKHILSKILDKVNINER